MGALAAEPRLFEPPERTPSYEHAAVLSAATPDSSASPIFGISGPRWREKTEAARPLSTSLGCRIASWSGSKRMIR